MTDHADPAARRYSRYSDQPTSWSARLFGMSGVFAIMLLFMGGALFTWRTYTVAPAAPALNVFDVTQPAAPPEPSSETPPGPERNEKPPLVPDRPRIDPPDVRLPAVNTLPVPVVQPIPDPSPPIQLETAPERQPTPPAPQVSHGKLTWEGKVLAALNRAKRYPREAQRARQQGVPYVRFVMDREGRVLSVRLERSSGIPALDDDAVKLPGRASPLPKPPDDVSAATIELVVPVEYFLRR